jgi:hypothetical protein
VTSIFTNDYLNVYLSSVKMLNVAYVALCGCKVDNGHGNYGFLWGQTTTELDDCRKYIHCILALLVE